MKLDINEKKNKVKEVTFELNEKELKPHYDHALEHFKDNVQVKGFRKGKAPKNKIKEKVDKEKLDQEVLQHVYPEIVQEAVKKFEVVPVMQPKIKIDEISEKTFKGTIIFVERPDVKLGDYKKLAKEAAKEIKKESENKDNDEDSGIVTAKNMNEVKQKTKEGVKKSSDKINKAKQQNKQDQEMSKEEKILSKAYEKLIKESKIELPEVMVQEETNRMLNQLLTQLSRLKISVEDYLKQAGVKMDEIRDNYEKQAKRSLKLEFILSEISKKEDIKVTEKEIQDVIDATPNEDQKKQLSQPNQKYYIESTLLKNKVANKIVEHAKK